MTSGSGTLAERYVLESPLESGGMGAVWVARDEVLARPVAVKVLHDHLSRDAAFVERFRREALAAARLTHPNIVSIYDTGTEGGPGDAERHFIVMEFCGGGTLADAVHKGPMDPERAAAIGRTICEALAYAHRNGVVHRDVKPENVLITEDGTLKVADFGIAKAAFADDDLTSTGSILGTVAYLSPEQAEGHEPDSRSDLYALGIVLYQLVTGRLPFEAESQIATAMKHMREPPPPPRSIRAGIPRALEAVILKALEKDPRRRFATAEAMGTALEEAAPGSGTQVLPPLPREPVRKRAEPDGVASGPDLRWVLPVLGVIAVVVLLALFLPGLLGGTPEPAGNDGGGGRPDGGGDRLRVAAVTDFDPDGDDTEHADEAAAAADGDEATVWTTESYDSSLEALGKSGVGLIFDLGEPAEVARVSISGDAAGVELRAGDDEPGSAEDLEVVAEEGSVSGTTEVTFDEPREARYWLVWITELPGGTGSASLAEITFFAP